MAFDTCHFTLISLSCWVYAWLIFGYFVPTATKLTVTMKTTAALQWSFSAISSYQSEFFS